MKIYIQANHSQLLRYGSWPKYFVMRNDSCIDDWHWKLPICTKNTWCLNWNVITEKQERRFLMLVKTFTKTKEIVKRWNTWFLQDKRYKCLFDKISVFQILFTEISGNLFFLKKIFWIWHKPAYLTIHSQEWSQFGIKQRFKNVIWRQLVIIRKFYIGLKFKSFSLFQVHLQKLKSALGESNLKHSLFYFF